MKKLLLIILIILLCVVTYVIIFNNFKIGILKIESINDIKAKSDELNQKLNQATELTAQSYPKVKSTLDSSVNNFKAIKQQYENKIASMPNSEVLKYMQVDNYEKEFLWATIGSYATEENLDLELDIVDIKNNDYYNLNFTVVGKYSDIADFLLSIENDDELGFRIENFSMKPYAITETTVITKYNGTEEPEEEEKIDDAYEITKEKEYTGEIEEDESMAENLLKGSNKNNTNKEKEEQTNSAVTIMYSPDRVKATFTVTKVNVNVN